jgi:hypothetical protein
MLSTQHITLGRTVYSYLVVKNPKDTAYKQQGLMDGSKLVNDSKLQTHKP